MIKTKMDGAQNEAIKKAPDQKDTFDLFFNSIELEAKHLEKFIISKKGITFFYDYGFPHVVEALTPKNYHYFSFKQLKPLMQDNAIVKAIVE